jgi:hypothetical protein
MRIYTTLILFLISCFSVKAQTPVETVKLADTLLTTGEHKVCLVTYRFSPDIEALQKKALDSLRHFKGGRLLDNKLDMKFLEDGTSSQLRYKPQFGLTREEYDTLFNAFQIRRKAVFGDTLSIRITNVKGIITFNTTGKLAVFNTLSINVSKAQIIYGGYLLTRETAVQGPFYAPPIAGYEVVWPVPVDRKKSNPNTGIMGLCIGRDNENKVPTIALLFKGILVRTEPVAIAFLN